MLSLARIGDRTALPTIAAVQNNTTGLVAFCAQFAAALISYRFGLAGNDLPIPNSGEYLELPAVGVNSVDIGPASAEEANLCVAWVAAEPFGIEYSQQAYQIRCGQSAWMILLNKTLNDRNAIQNILEQKQIAGIVASKNTIDGSYSVSLLILASPSGDPKVSTLLVPRTSGTLSFAGTVNAQDNQVGFSIRSVSRPGASPVKIEGSLGPGGLKISFAEGGTSVLPRRQPAPAGRPTQLLSGRWGN